MQINIALDIDNKKQAEIIRKVKYPNTTVNQIRDAFIFNQCIDEFNDDLQVLLIYAERDKDCQIVQRMLTIKAESNERLKTIAASLKLSVAATYRSIIAYSVDKVSDDNIVAEEMPDVKLATENQRLREKVALLENQLIACNKTLEDIKAILYEER